jgi:hypothetical protein
MCRWRSWISRIWIRFIATVSFPYHSSQDNCLEAELLSVTATRLRVPRMEQRRCGETPVLCYEIPLGPELCCQPRVSRSTSLACVYSSSYPVLTSLWLSYENALPNSWALISAFLLLCLVFHRRSKETRSAWEAHRKEVHPPKRQMRLVL